MENICTNLFVYGSLRSQFNNSAFKYISHYFILKGEAKVQGLLYSEDYPAAVPTTELKFITGELFTAKNYDDFTIAIKELDIYEEAVPEEGEASLYRREITEVLCNNIVVQSWIYWYNRNVNNKNLIPSGDMNDISRI